MMLKEWYIFWKFLKVFYYLIWLCISSDEFIFVCCFIFNKMNLMVFLFKFEFSFVEVLLERYKKKDIRKELKFV